MPPAAMPKYILGLDVGTTSIKAVLLDSASTTVVVSQTLPTISDINYSNDIKVRVNTTCTLMNLNYCVFSVCNAATLPHHAG